MGEEDYEFRFEMGIGHSPASPDDQLRIVDCMCKHYSIIIIKAQLDQILCGLSSTMNLLYLMREYPAKFRPLLVWSQPDKVSGDLLYSLFKPILSPDGSNKREQEELVLMWWADMIY